jgi:two-component system cell cycle sensor histidine kinase/response regulator CckA
MDLNEAVTRAIPLVRVLCGERIELLTDLNPSCGHVRADPRHINQIILNIAADACHAMSGRGRLTVRTMNADLVWPATGGTTPPAGRYVLLEIRDMREPPPTELLDAIFEPYMRAAGQVGLRLSVAHALVTQNEGWISAEPAAGGGLAFRIHFPRLDEEAPTAQ